MRALAVVVVTVLAFTVSTGSAQTKASELADATHDELEAEKHKAEQLKALLDVLTQPDRPQTSEAPAQDQKQRAARSSQPRPDEPSGVGIPAPAPRVVNEYQRLRDRVEQSRDPDEHGRYRQITIHGIDDSIELPATLGAAELRVADLIPRSSG